MSRNIALFDSCHRGHNEVWITRQWCFLYERAVGRYVKQTSNKKGVEKTFARKKSLKEFIKAWSEQNKLKVLTSKQTGKFDQRKVICTSFLLLW